MALTKCQFSKKTLLYLVKFITISVFLTCKVFDSIIILSRSCTGCNQGIPIVTLYSYLSILVGKISTVFLQNLEYLLTDQG